MWSKRPSLVHSHNLFPKAINKRLISLRIHLPHDNLLTLISVYTSTLESDEPVKDEFYRQLNGPISSVTPRDKLIVRGYFNVRVGKETSTWRPVIGNKRRGNCDEKGVRLLGIYAEQKLLITNIIFQLLPGRRSRGGILDLNNDTLWTVPSPP